MLIGLPVYETVSPVVYLEHGVQDQTQVFTETSATGGQNLSEIRFEQTVYRCPNRIRLNYQFDSQIWKCWARELPSVCIGKGESIKVARDDWHQQFHATFQRLYSTRSFEMNEEDFHRWEDILSVIDVTEYRLSKPLSVREVGCVRFPRTPYPSQIRWIDGRKEHFSLHGSPVELAGCKPGQWIEAIVEREPQTGKLLKIIHIQKIPSPLPESSGGIRSAWKSMEAAKLPEANWNWLGLDVPSSAGMNGDAE